MKKLKELTYMVRKRTLRKEEKWVATLLPQERRTFKSMCEMVSVQSSARPGEVSGVLRACLEQIRFHVLNGESVNIEGFGTFYPRITTKLVDTADEATVNNCVKNVTIGFRPADAAVNVVKDAALREFSPAKNSSEGRRSA